MIEQVPVDAQPGLTGAVVPDHDRMLETVLTELARVEHGRVAGWSARHRRDCERASGPGVRDRRKAPGLRAVPRVVGIRAARGIAAIRLLAGIARIVHGASTT